MAGRLMIHEDIYNDVLNRITDIVSRLRIGDPMRADSDMGLLNPAGQYRKVMSYIDRSWRWCSIDDGWEASERQRDLLGV
jgi:acyl-CoA reductase-like NAD-dependent aldehyde dehydrogenase